MDEQLKQKRRNITIELLNKKDIVGILLELVTSDNRFYQGTYEEKAGLFKKNYASLIFDFCRYLQHLQLFEENSKKYQEFFEDRTLIPVIFTFDQFMVIRQEGKLEYLLKYGTTERPEEKRTAEEKVEKVANLIDKPKKQAKKGKNK